MSTRTTSPYSEDLRKRVIKYLSQGNSQRQASSLFRVHVNTVNRWWVRYQKEGNYCARKRSGGPSKVDQPKLEKVVQSNPNIKLQELGSQFNISGFHASRILKKLGFSYKKKLHLSGSKTRRSSCFLKQA